MSEGLVFRAKTGPYGLLEKNLHTSLCSGVFVFGKVLSVDKSHQARVTIKKPGKASAGNVVRQV